ncbi:hypothetical protein AGOR_G00120580 [Albula goreensis]|uniref:Fucolectin tachylectin-4 pentraxin-1 domain-containing protein n=1 Tax=Albula goreensis TaxID=1534307 RepID=A0A8T3DFC8_9TELE|nr:hypothetical protein AGOR_G00120580 [Albula goreensis]
MKLKTAVLLLQILAVSSLIPPGLGNVALRKEATQSDTAYGGPASLAVDGNRSPIYGQKSCTHTSNRANPWWRVDLLKPYKIFSVTITNRKDCCASRINGAQIRIGNSLENNGNNNPLCSTVPSISPGPSQTFKCSGPMVGRYVNVYIPRREFLTLCEVEVNGEEADDGNVALRKEATQSDTAYGGPASLAVDGNRSPIYGQKSCTHTSNRANPWWRVDLLKPYKIFSVTITNRKDCCASRINGAQIRIGNSLENNGNNNPLCSTVPSIGPGPSQTFKCSGPMVGRYVNVYIPRREFLTLCEVEVNGEEANELPDYGNVALRKEATQSDTAYGGPASLAVDGNRSPIYGQKSCTHTSNRANPWWRVDLLKPHKIFSVTITNRKDCCASRINGAQIRIGNSLENNGNNNPLCSTVPSISPGPSQTFKCSGPMVGRYVNVYIPRREFLTLCEVEVNGEEANELPDYEEEDQC